MIAFIGHQQLLNSVTNVSESDFQWKEKAWWSGAIRSNPVSPPQEHSQPMELKLDPAATSEHLAERLDGTPEYIFQHIPAGASRTASTCCRNSILDSSDDGNQSTIRAEARGQDSSTQESQRKLRNSPGRLLHYIDCGARQELNQQTTGETISYV